MTSHVRHRRSDNANDVPPSPIEPGELSVNTANRQLVAGTPGGTPVALIAVRHFDVRSKYAVNDLVAYNGELWAATAPIPPGAFNQTMWRRVSVDPVDPTDLTAYVQKSGGANAIMTGPITLPGDPTNDLHATTKEYVDNAHPPPPAAINVPITPVGNVQASNVQSAIAELDSEKVAKAGDFMSGHLVLMQASPEAYHAVRRDYVDWFVNNLTSTKVSKAGDTMSGGLIVNGDVFANRGANSGCLFLGSNGQHYLFFDGATYVLPGGGLNVGGLVNAYGGASVSGAALNVYEGANFEFGKDVVFNTSANYLTAARSNMLVQGVPGSPWPTMSFHAPGYFGANFGMGIDGNFYIGGWSYGEGNHARVMTTRDSVITAERMIHVTDYWHLTYSGFVEPGGPHCFITGMTGSTSPDGWNYGILARYRALQVLQSGGWYTVGAVS